MEEIKIAQALLSATSARTIQSYLIWLREYGNKKFFDKELGKKNKCFTIFIFSRWKRKSN